MDRNEIIIEKAKNYFREHPNKMVNTDEINEDNIIVYSPPDVRSVFYEYNATATGRANGNQFPLTRDFVSEVVYLYTIDENYKPVVQKHLEETLGEGYKEVHENDRIYYYQSDALEVDGYWKFRNEYHMYGGIVNAGSIRINNYTPHVCSTEKCKYSPIFLKVTDGGESKEIYIGCVKGKDGNFEVYIEPESKSDANKNSAAIGCLAIGIGLFFPPVLIGYVAYLIYKNINKNKNN